MSDKIIPYVTIDQQIEKLKNQGLIINDIDFAREQLQLYGYSNLIKSYRDPYVYIENGIKKYRSGITFEQVWSLYMLDKNLRNAVIGAMLDLEEYIKEAAADTVARSFGIHQNNYLDFKNYSDKKIRKYRFSLPAILKVMRDTLDTDKNPICHYMRKDGIVPPWILFKSIYFGTIVNFVNLFRPREQILMASKLYNFDVSKLSADSLTEFKFFMMDSLFIYLEYRNLAAHGGRIYNHNCDSKLRPSRLTDPDTQGFSQLLFLLHSLDYKEPYSFLSRSLNQQISRHCGSFPNDVTYLGQILNVNITLKEIVWVTKNSQKYHYDKHCSGLHDPMEMDLPEAALRGYLPCKRCCKM